MKPSSEALALKQPHPKICPWWWGFSLLLPFRKWFQGQDPAKILKPFVKEGMTVLEPGPGMGYFTLEAARLVGPTGKVVAVDIQPQMLEGLKRRAEKAGLSERIEIRLAKSSEELGIRDLEDKVDFILAFYMAHEVPDAGRFFQDLFRAAKPGCRLLIAEPPLHVKERQFETSVAVAQACGFKIAEPIHVPGSYSALLTKEKGRNKALVPGKHMTRVIRKPGVSFYAESGGRPEGPLPRERRS